MKKIPLLFKNLALHFNVLPHSLTVEHMSSFIGLTLMMPGAEGWAWTIQSVHHLSKDTFSFGGARDKDWWHIDYTDKDNIPYILMPVVEDKTPKSDPMP